MTTTASLLPTVLEVVAILAFIVWRQLAPRRVRERSVVPVLLGVLGVGMVVQFAMVQALTPGLLASLVVGLALSVGFAYPRAASLSIWRTEDGAFMRRGTAATFGWWLAVFAARFAIGAVIPRVFGESPSVAMSFSLSSILLGLAATLAAQQLFLVRRCQATLAPLAA